MNILSITLVLQDLPQGYIVCYYRPLRTLSLFRFSVEFSLKLVLPAMVGENFQIYVVYITGKCTCELKKLNLGIFNHAPWGKSLPKWVLITIPRQRGITYFLQSAQFFLYLLSRSSKRGRGNYGESAILFIKKMHKLFAIMQHRQNTKKTFTFISRII